MARQYNEEDDYQDPLAEELANYVGDQGGGGGQVQAQAAPPDYQGGDSGAPAGGDSTAPPIDNATPNDPGPITPPISAPSPAPAGAAATPGFDVLAALQAKLGSLYDPSIGQDAIRNISYAQNAGVSPQSIVDRIVARNLLRATNQPGSTYTPNGKGGYMTAPKPVARTAGGGGTGGGMGADASSALIQQLMASILGGGAAGAGTGLGGGGGTGAPAGGGGSTDPFRQQILDSLKQLIAQGSEPIGDVSNDPRSRAARTSAQRNYEQARSEAAERRASQGLLFSGATETDINAAQQQRAETQQVVEAQIAGSLLQDRKEKLTTALQLGAGIISEDQRLQVQKELAQVEQALHSTQLQLQLAQSLMQNQQFYDKLGYDLGLQEAGLNSGSVGALGH